jgi:nitronate monooxygenase
MWPDRRVIELFGVEHPILLAPIAGPGTAELAIAIAEAGGLCAIPSAMLQPDEIRANLQVIRRRTSRPINLNFFTHKMPEADALSELRWRKCLAAYRDQSAAARYQNRDPTSERDPR